MSNKVVYTSIGVLVALIGLLVALMNFNTQRVSSDLEELTIVVEGKSAGQFTIEEIKKLPAVEKDFTIHSSSEGVSTYRFTGVSMREVFKQINPGLTLEGKQVTVKGIDGYQVVLEGSEIISDDKVLLVYAQDQKPLGNKRQGGTGPLRLIISGDQFGLRAVKYVHELEVQ